MDEEMDGLDSELTFGYYDKSKYTGDMVWHPILHKLMFGIQLDDIKVNGKAMKICGKEGQEKCLITVDSGTSEMTMPTWALNQVIGKMPLKYNSMICRNQTDYGDLTFIINGFEYTLPNDDWVNKIPDYDANSAAQLLGPTKIYSSLEAEEGHVEAAQVGPMRNEFLDEIMDQSLSQTNTGPIKAKDNLQTNTDIHDK